MQYRQLGNAGLKVSEIALGSWLTYGNSTEKETAMKTIARAYELGINYFDTANVYAFGKAETVVGEALKKYPRESYVLASKVFFPMGEGPNDRGLSRKHITEQAHASLKRLGVEYIDLYYCHRFDESTPVYESLRAIDDLVRQGKVLYAGVSQWTAAQIQQALATADRYLLDRIVVNQPPYHMLERKIEAEVIPLCLQNGIGQAVYSPLAQGVLTGKYTSLADLPPGSRATDPKANFFLERYLTEEILAKVSRLKQVAQQMGVTMAQLALAWVLHQPGISSAIIGASRPSQVDENVKAVDVEIGADVLQEIEDILQNGMSQTD